MKRSTMVRHLAEIAEAADRLVELTPEFDMPPLREVWVGGDLVEPGDDVGHVVAILQFDVAVDELTEITLHDAELTLHYWLRVGKRPMIWRSRPTSRPTWSHLERRVARVWSAASGTAAANLTGLRSRDLPGVEVVEPTPDELRAWLAAELPRSEAHLRQVLDHYWEGRWRQRHTGNGIHPDDHLWRAAWASQSMRDALAELESC